MQGERQLCMADRPGVASGPDPSCTAGGQSLGTGHGGDARSPARGRPARLGQRMGGLTALEKKIVAGAAAGRWVDCGGGEFRLAEMQRWAEGRTVRAVVLRHLLVSGRWPVDAKGVRLRGVRIDGHLDLEAATLRCPLLLDCCYLDADDPVGLDHATAALIALTGCRAAGLAGDMLVARELDLSDSAFTGPVKLRCADIAGQFSCRGARLAGPDSDGYVLVADRLKAGGSVFFDRGFTATGAILLLGAEIAGALGCTGAQLTGADSDGTALFADRLKAGGGVFLNSGFSAAGAVRLPAAIITGELNCSGARLTGSDSNGHALVAADLRVTGEVLLSEGFSATAAVYLESAQVGEDVYLTSAKLAGENKVAFGASRARIGGTLRWKPAEQVRGQVNLEGASAGQLEDDWSTGRPNGCWPADGRLRLDGFTYDRFGGDQQATVGQRLEWIRSQYQPHAGAGRPAFAAQPYEQLATVYRQAGHDTQARHVAIARRADLRKYGHLDPYRKASNWLLDKTIKYGYQTWRAGAALAALYVAAWMLAILAQHLQLIVPVADVSGLHPVPSANLCTATYPCFYPAGYAADTVVPIINVHQAQYWGPNGHAPWGWAWVSGTWIATGLGWALATLLVAGYTGLVRAP